MLSAAHCAKLNPTVATLGMHKLRLGDTEASEFNELVHIPIDIEASTIHPRYDPETESYDFWMIKLKWNADSSRYPPVQMESPSNPPISTGHLLTTMGFGTTANGLSSNVLQEVAVKYVTNADCAAKYATAPTPRRIFDSMLCAGETGGDSCKVNIILHSLVSISCPFLVLVSTTHLLFPILYFRVTRVDLSFIPKPRGSSVLYHGVKDVPNQIILVCMPVLAKVMTLSIRRLVNGPIRMLTLPRRLVMTARLDSMIEMVPSITACGTKRQGTAIMAVRTGMPVSRPRMLVVSVRLIKVGHCRHIIQRRCQLSIQHHYLPLLRHHRQRQGSQRRRHRNR